MQICRDIYAKGVKGVARMRLLLGDIRYESANYLNFHARKKHQTILLAMRLVLVLLATFLHSLLNFLNLQNLIGLYAFNNIRRWQMLAISLVIKVPPFSLGRGLLEACRACWWACLSEAGFLWNRSLCSRLLWLAKGQSWLWRLCVLVKRNLWAISTVTS